MNWWSQKHKILAVVMGAFLCLWCAAYLLFVLPQSSEVSTGNAALEQTRQHLSQTGWPLRATDLRQELLRLESRLNGRAGRGGIQGTADAMVRHSTGMFGPKIREFFGNRRSFIRGVSRLDYQEEFNRLQQKLSSRGVALSPEILKLGEDTSSSYTYQLVLQVWMLGFLTDLLHRNKLEFVTDTVRTTVVAGKPVPAALMEVQPLRAYQLNEKSRKPYLLEIPVKVTVLGTLPDLASFLHESVSNDQFLPVCALQIFPDDPGKDVYRETGKIRVNRVRVVMECSAFFSLENDEGDAEPPPTQRPRLQGGLLPQGA